MLRILSISLTLWRVALQRDIEFRGNFIFSVVLSILVFTIGLVVVKTFFSEGRSFHGWDFIDMILLFGVYQIVDGFVLVFFRPSLSMMSMYVRSGQLEYVLTRPVDAQLHISLSYLDVWSAPTLALGLGTVTYVFVVSGMPPVTNLLAGIICLIAGISICYAIVLMINTLSIWVVRVSTGNGLFSTVLNLSRFPLQNLPEALQFLFVWIVPIFFITTAPTLLLRGESVATLVPLSLALAVLFLVFSRVLFLHALRSFTGAGG